MKRRITGLHAKHSLVYSRNLVDPRTLTEEMRNELPPSRQPLVRLNPVNGRGSMFVGSHASHLVGWPLDEMRALLKELNEFVTQPRFVYSHLWCAGDLIAWDNRGATISAAQSKYPARKEKIPGCRAFFV